MKNNFDQDIKGLPDESTPMTSPPQHGATALSCNTRYEGIKWRKGPRNTRDLVELLTCTRIWSTHNQPSHLPALFAGLLDFLASRAAKLQEIARRVFEIEGACHRHGGRMVDRPLKGHLVFAKNFYRFVHLLKA